MIERKKGNGFRVGKDCGWVAVDGGAVEDQVVVVLKGLPGVGAELAVVVPKLEPAAAEGWVAP